MRRLTLCCLGFGPLRSAALLLVILASVSRFCCPAAAQQGGDTTAKNAAPAAPPENASKVPAGYRELRVDESQKRIRSKIHHVLRSGFGPGDQEVFEKYYRTYALPIWTRAGKYPELPRSRQVLRNELAVTKGGPVHNRLNELALEFMTNLAKGPRLHPAVRFNAMLMIGDLNTRPPARPTDDPVALPAAFPVLMQALGDQNQIDAVKVAAMIGILRRAHLGIPDSDTRKQITDVMLKLATTKAAPGRSADGHAWFRHRAIKVLELLGSVGQQGAVAKPLSAIVSETDAPFSVRCAAARALGKLDFAQPSGLKPAPVVRQLGQLALDATKHEIEQCKKDDRTINPQILKSRLISVRIALTGTKKQLRADDKPRGGIARLATKTEDMNVLEAVRKLVERELGHLDDKRLTPKPEEEEKPEGLGLGEFGPGLGRIRPGFPGGGLLGEEEEESEIEIASKEVIKKLSEEIDKLAKVLQAIPE